MTWMWPPILPQRTYVDHGDDVLVEGKSCSDQRSNASEASCCATIQHSMPVQQMDQYFADGAR